VLELRLGVDSSPTCYSREIDDQSAVGPRHVNGGKVPVKLTEVVKALARLVGALENASTQVFTVFLGRACSDMWIAVGGR
jgi:hypothetical protein